MNIHMVEYSGWGCKRAVKGFIIRVLILKSKLKYINLHAVSIK